MDKKATEANAAVASLAGLVMRRLQDEEGVPGVGAEDLTAVTVGGLHRIFGEVLEQFSRPEEEHSQRVLDEDGA